MQTFGIEGAAGFLNISTDRLLDLAAKGTVPGAKIGKSWVFTDEDLGEYLRAEVRKQTADRRGEKLVPVQVEFLTTRPGRRRPTTPPPIFGVLKS